MCCGVCCPGSVRAWTLYHTVLKMMDEETSASVHGGGVLLLRWGPHVQVEEIGVARDFSFLPSLELGEVDMRGARMINQFWS
jgi:hypothetical protein